MAPEEREILCALVTDVVARVLAERGREFEQELAKLEPGLAKLESIFERMQGLLERLQQIENAMQREPIAKMN